MWTLRIHMPTAREVKHEYGYDLAPEMKGPYDAIIVAVNHSRIRQHTTRHGSRVHAETERRAG
jgi:hypothetical protein